MKTAIQLYSVRDIDAPLHEIIERVAHAGYDGVEFANRFLDADPNTIADTLDDTGIQAVAAHVGMDTVTGNVDTTLDRYNTIGCDTLIIPGVSSERFESVKSVNILAQEFNEIAAHLETMGVNLGYHNHHHEFRREDETRSAFDAFVTATNDELLFELDTGGAATGGEDPASVLRKFDGEQCPFLHFKDVYLDETGPETSQTSADIGNGDIDLGRCVNAAEDIGCEWIIYEDDEPSNPETAIENGMNVISDLL